MIREGSDFGVIQTVRKTIRFLDAKQRRAWLRLIPISVTVAAMQAIGAQRSTGVDNSRQGFQTRRPATQPVMKVAREPDTMERTPSDATSGLRLGARPPIPPNKMASEPKFAKPQSA